jgi:hypothetical protein
VSAARVRALIGCSGQGDTQPGVGGDEHPAGVAPLDDPPRPAASSALSSDDSSARPTGAPRQKWRPAPNRSCRVSGRDPRSRSRPPGALLAVYAGQQHPLAGPQPPAGDLQVRADQVADHRHRGGDPQPLAHRVGQPPRLGAYWRTIVNGELAIPRRRGRPSAVSTAARVRTWRPVRCRARRAVPGTCRSGAAPSPRRTARQDRTGRCR